MVDVVNNPEDPTAGTRSVPFTGELWIEQDDFMADPPPKYFRLTPGREVRLRNAFFVTATEAVLDDDGNVVEVLATYDPETLGGNAPDNRKVKSTMHWVSRPHAVDATVHRYERLFRSAHPAADGRDPLETSTRTPAGPCEPRSSRRWPSVSSPARSCSSSGSATSPPTSTTPRSSTAPSASATSGPTSRSASPEPVGV